MHAHAVDKIYCPCKLVAARGSQIMSSTTKLCFKKVHPYDFHDNNVKQDATLSLRRPRDAPNI